MLRRIANLTVKSNLNTFTRQYQSAGIKSIGKYRKTVIISSSFGGLFFYDYFIREGLFYIIYVCFLCDNNNY